MEKTIIKFDDIKIAKQKFLRPNSLKNLYLYVYFSRK